MRRPELTERALDLARRGATRSAALRILQREGYSQVASALDGFEIRRQMRRLRTDYLAAQAQTEGVDDDNA